MATQTEARSPIRTALLVLGVGALTAGTGLLIGIEATTAAVEADPAPRATASLPVATQALAIEREVVRSMRFTGRVEASRLSGIGFERGGEIRGLAVDEGDAVRAGQVVARLDTSRLSSRQQELNAALAVAIAERDLARTTLTRIRNLAGQRHASRQALDEASENQRATEAAVALAEARLASLQTDLSRSVLRAPFDAVVVARHMDEGQVAGAGEPVLLVQERGRDVARIGVALRHASRLEVGSVQTLIIDDVAVEARLRAVLPTTDARARTVDVLFDLPPDTHAIPGSLATLDVAETVPGTGAWVPMAALTAGLRGSWSLYVLEPPAIDTPQSSPLATVRRLNVELITERGDRAFVSGPLTDGLRFISAGLNRVVPGQAVLAAAPGSARS